MGGPDRFPGFPLQEEETDDALHSLKGHLRPQPGGFFMPRNPGMFQLFLFPGLPGLHGQEKAVLLPGDSGQPVTADQQAEPGRIPFPDPFRVHCHLRAAAGQHSALRDGVPGIFHGPADPVRPDPVCAVPGFPGSFPRFMVELPERIQLFIRKVVVRIQRFRGPARTGGIIHDFLCHVPENRISEPVPGYGNQYRNPPRSAPVLEQHSKPPAVRRIHNPALGRAAVHPVQVHCQHVSAGPDAFQVVRDKAGLRPEPLPLL